MRRWLKVLLGILAALVVLLILNAVVLDHQTKDAEITVDGATILPLPGGDLQVLDTGAGVPIKGQSTIVLLHCYTCSINWWDKLIPPLERAGHRVIAIDLLGHGGSEMPSNGYSMQDQAQLVAQALDRLGAKGPLTVVGHSLGGAVGVALAEQSPQLVGRLVIVDSEPDSSYGSLDLLARAAYTPILGEALWRVKMEWTIRKALSQAFAPGYDVPDQFVDDVKRLTYTAYDDSHSAYDSYVGESRLDKRISALGIPLLAIFGAEDQIIDARKALSAYAGVTGAQTALIQGAGHSPNVEKPTEAAQLILRFAKSVAASEAPRSSPGGNRNRVAARKITADCDSIRLAGAGDPNWRKRSTVVGRFGLYGSGRNLSTASRMGTAFVTKIPAILEGRKAVTLRVPASEEGRIGLIYGGHLFVHAVDEGAAQVTFKPCPDKPRTTWPGGLALADRHPITLEVLIDGSVKKVRIG
ncbi:MAG: alpha/beta fold hydrolase [Actinomycetota bacterium]|nr:alpha/beta fold hydrolase [Actinomycetota bacterium]